MEQNNNNKMMASAVVIQARSGKIYCPHNSKITLIISTDLSKNLIFKSLRTHNCANNSHKSHLTCTNIFPSVST